MLMAREIGGAEKLNRLRRHADKVLWHLGETVRSLKGLERGELDLGLNVPQHIEGRTLESAFGISIPKRLVELAGKLNAAARALEARKIGFLAGTLGLPATTTRERLIWVGRDLTKAEGDRLKHAENGFHVEHAGAYRSLLKKKRAIESAYHAFLLAEIRKLAG